MNTHSFTRSKTLLLSPFLRWWLIIRNWQEIFRLWHQQWSAVCVKCLIHKKKEKKVELLKSLKIKFKTSITELCQSDKHFQGQKSTKDIRLRCCRSTGKHQKVLHRCKSVKPDICQQAWEAQMVMSSMIINTEVINKAYMQHLPSGNVWKPHLHLTANIRVAHNVLLLLVFCSYLLCRG